MADGIKINITSDDESVLKDLEKIESKARKTFERAAAAAKKTANEIAALDQKMKDLAAAKRVELGAGLPWKPEELDAIVDKALDSDKAFRRMTAAMDQLQTKWQAQTDAANEAKDAYSQASQKADEAAKNISKKASVVDKLKQAFAGLAARLGLTGRESKKAEKGLKKTNDRAKPLTKSILKLSSMFKLLLLRMVMRKAIEAMRKGFQDLAQYSDAFNKTMSQLSTTILYARNAIATAFAPVLEALTPIIVDVTNRFIDMTNIVAAFTANLFGNATTFTKAKKAAVDYAKSVAGATKANKKALASFDELNIIGDNDSGMPTPAEMFEEEEIEATILTISDRVKDLFEDWRKAAEPTIKAVKDLASNLEPLKDFVAQGLINFYERFLEPVSGWVLGEGIPRLVDALKNGLAKIDLTKVSDSLNRLWDALKPFAVKVGEGLVWLWENVLVPLGEWTVSNLLPAFLDLLAGALDALGSIIDALRPLFEWLWNEFLEPLAQWTGDLIIKAIHWLTDAFERFSDWARANPETIRTMAEIILGFLAGLWVYNTTKKIVTFITSALIPAFTGLGGAINAAAISSTVATIGFAALAAAVLQYLVNLGVAASRLRAVGYGYDRPKAPNDPVQGNLANRRVDVYLYGAGGNAAKERYVNP